MIGDIRNVTTRENPNPIVWQSLDLLEISYDEIFIDPIEKNLATHKDLFVSAYNALDDS